MNRARLVVAAVILGLAAFWFGVVALCRLVFPRKGPASVSARTARPEIASACDAAVCCVMGQGYPGRRRNRSHNYENASISMRTGIACVGRIRR
jgi:hypothetical protein